ncbi:MAG TPA: PadR family transcriptional regulator [Terriglobales bacterium]|nr:PadR family transcriptional regulator [Terriglobales bacterium]
MPVTGIKILIPVDLAGFGTSSVPDHNISLLAYALLGLLQQEPRSGYDLRKIFSATPLTSFSDSPGSIYPALERLERQGLIRSRVEERSGLRRRRLFRLTTAGVNELKGWQSRPLIRDDVIRGV